MGDKQNPSLGSDRLAALPIWLWEKLPTSLALKLWSFSKGPALLLTPSPSPDVGSTTQRDEVDLV